MKPRLLLVIIGILAIAGVAFFLIARYVLTTTAPEVATPEDTSSLPVVTPSSDGLTFSGPGGTVRTNDFYAAAVASTSYAVTLYADDAVGIIDFYPETRSFNIGVSGITNGVFGANRATLEQELLRLLGVSQEDACKLPVFLGTGGTGNEDLDGVPFNLSFCPGSFPTP